jgi:hypothetical protein
VKAIKQARRTLDEVKALEEARRQPIEAETSDADLVAEPEPEPLSQSPTPAEPVERWRDKHPHQVGPLSLRETVLDQARRMGRSDGDGKRHFLIWWTTAQLFPLPVALERRLTILSLCATKTITAPSEQSVLNGYVPTRPTLGPFTRYLCCLLLTAVALAVSLECAVGLISLLSRQYRAGHPPLNDFQPGVCRRMLSLAR